MQPGAQRGVGRACAGCLGDDGDGFDPGSDGGGSSSEEDTAKKTPYQCATRIFVAWAEEKGTVRFKDRKDGGVYFAVEACDFVAWICRYFEPLQDDDGLHVTAEDVLNMAMADLPDLQALMDATAPLFDQVVSGLKKKRMGSWGFKKISRSIVSFADGYLDFSGRDSRGMPVHRWVANDGCEADKVAAVHLPVRFDPEWLTLSPSELLEACPVFAKVLGDQAELASCTGALTFSDRGGSKSFTGTELLVACLGRLLHAGTYNDGMRFMLWLMGPTGTGKTDVFFALIASLLGNSQVQVAQDGKYGDKWVINADAMVMSLLALQDVRGEPVTLEQLLKLVNKEKIATRAMRQQASDVTPICNLLATSNQRPAWDDPHGALTGRIFEIPLEQPAQLDSSVPERMKGELHFILLLLLRGYADLSAHVKATPFKEWQHPLLTDSRRTQEAGHPLAEMLMDGEVAVTVGGSVITVKPETGATVGLDRLQAVLDAFCDAARRDRATLTGKAVDATVRALLKRISDLLELGDDRCDEHSLKLINKKNVFRCKECGEDVNGPDEPRRLPGGIASTHCLEGCSTECPAGCSDPGSDFKAAYAAKIKRSTKAVKPAYVKNLRVTEAGAMGGFFGGEPTSC